MQLGLHVWFNVCVYYWFLSVFGMWMHLWWSLCFNVYAYDWYVWLNTSYDFACAMSKRGHTTWSCVCVLCARAISCALEEGMYLFLWLCTLTHVCACIFIGGLGVLECVNMYVSVPSSPSLWIRFHKATMCKRGRIRGIVRCEYLPW